MARIALKKLTHFVLDYKKWRAGRNGGNRVGKGDDTYLLNQEGYMCCLGQFCEQAGFEKESLWNVENPSTLSTTTRITIPVLTQKSHNQYYRFDSPVAGLMMDINDDADIGTKRRLIGLAEALLGVGITMEVINLPKKLQ